MPRLSIVDVALRLSGTTQGLDQARSVIAYRETLALLGLTSGFQWIPGPSTTARRRSTRSARPTDVDVITFCHRPTQATTATAWRQFVELNQPLLDPGRVWAGFGCRSYLVDLDAAPEVVVTHTRFWIDVLTRQRRERNCEFIEAPLSVADDDVAVRLVPWS